MSQTASTITRSPAEIVQSSPVSQAPNGICYARSGEVMIAENDLDRMIAAVPASIASALTRKAYYFVPLTVSQGEETLIAERYDVVLSDSAVCHRNLSIGDAQCVFISTRLMDDKFSWRSNSLLMWDTRWWSAREFRRRLPIWRGSKWKRACAERPRWMRGSRGRWPRCRRRTRRSIRPNIWRRVLPMRSRFICWRLSGRGLLRFAGAGLSAAGAGSHGRAAAESGGNFSAESGV